MTSATSPRWKRSGSSSAARRPSTPRKHAEPRSTATPGLSPRSDAPAERAAASAPPAGSALRLNRFLALAGWGARRKCDDLIRTGRVSVNGVAVSEPGGRVDPRRDRVAVDGETVRLPKPVAILLHKPPGVLVTKSDPERRRTVVDLLRGAPEGIFPVGRLDRDSEGLLLLTNDGDLAFRLTHPRFGVERRYIATVRGTIAPVALRRLERGVALADGVTAPAKARVVKRLSGGGVIEIVLREGKNREVRRMCAAVGLGVTRLVRIAYGPLRLAGLRPGAWRRLQPREIAGLRLEVGLEAGS